MKRLAFVDVLRGIAILVVIVHHLPESLASPFGQVAVMGGRGVDLFFVLSGFLIGSTSLARADSGAGRLEQGKAYWLLRTLRIWPLYFLLLAICAVGAPGINKDVTYVVRNYPWHYLTFTSNDFAQGTLELGVLWSLAIEEQFYLAVGIVVMFCSRNRATLSGAFVGMAIAAIAVALRTRYDLDGLLAAQALEEKWYVFKLYHSTLSRIDQLALGLLSATIAAAFNASRVVSKASDSHISSWVAIGLTVAGLIYLPQHPVVGFLGLGVLFVGCILWVQRPVQQALQLNRMERAVLAFLGGAGRYSFGLYMVHPYVRHWVSGAYARFEVPSSTWTAALFLFLWISVSWLLAFVTYRWIEEPVLNWARHRATKMLSAGRMQASKTAAVIA